MVVVWFILLFLFMFCLITSKLPNAGNIITSLGDNIFHFFTDKNYINEYNRSVNIFGLLASKIRMLFKKEKDV